MPRIIARGIERAEIFRSRNAVSDYTGAEKVEVDHDTLKPGDPELEQNIRRAETFLQNLDRWGK
ncbi:MAG: hypothetical protein U5L07_08675 [Desulfobacterales bacterium]|nr:hypothetical protein [Desulfobacterales bacterium]